MLPKKRTRSLRAIGWLAVTGLVGMAALGPAAGATSANDLHQTPPIAWDTTGFGGGACKSLNDDQVLWHFIQGGVPSGVTSATLTVTFASAGTMTVDSLDRASGTLHWDVVTGHDTLLDAVSDVQSDGNLNLSHVCVPEASASPSPAASPSESAAPSESVTPSESAQPSESVSPSVAPSKSASPTATPPGGVEAATATPRLTPPSTDAAPGPEAAASNGSWRLMLLAMAGLLAAILVLTPATRAIRRD
jgi:hypothetical protein